MSYNKQISDYTFPQSHISAASTITESNQEIHVLLQKSDNVLQDIKERKSKMSIKSLKKNSENMIAVQSSKKPIFNIIRDFTNLK